jgi:hypothetical protein
MILRFASIQQTHHIVHRITYSKRSFIRPKEGPQYHGDTCLSDHCCNILASSYHLRCTRRHSRLRVLLVVMVVGGGGGGVSGVVQIRCERTCAVEWKGKCWRR